MSPSKVLSWARSSLLGHILVFGLGAGGVGAAAFSVLLGTEEPLTAISLMEIFSYWILTMAVIGTLFWFTTTLPSKRRK